MIGNNHQRSRTHIDVQRTRRVGQNHCFDAQFFVRANHQSQSRGAVSFVKMDASLHAQNVDAVQLADDQPTGVTGYGGTGKSVDFFIRDDDGVFDGFRHAAQAAAQNDADLGFMVADFGFNLLSNLIDNVLHKSPRIFFVPI